MLLSRLFLAKERVPEDEELQLNVAKIGLRLHLVWSHNFLAVEEELNFVTPSSAVEDAVSELQVLVHEWEHWHKRWLVVFIDRPPQ